MSMVSGHTKLVSNSMRSQIPEERITFALKLGLRLNHSQKATAAARLTADKKFLASLS